MIFMAIRPGASTTPQGGIPPSLTLLQSLGVTVPEGAVPADVLREVLSPLLKNPPLIAQLSLSPEVCRDLAGFVEGGHEEPSAPLLEALHSKFQDLKSLLGIERKALDYPYFTDEARARHDAGVKEAVDRLLRGIHERARTSLVATPKAISLKEVLEHPEDYQDQPLNIVLFDVDGTTHKGETFLEGQYSVEWLLRDILRYGPKATAGLSWWRVLKAIPGIVKLRRQERKHKADREMFNRTFGPLLKGLDGRLAEESLKRFYDRYGSRGISEFMMAEFIRRRQAGCLIIGVSASPEFLVKRHAERDLGIPEANMLGTTIELDQDEKATGGFRWLHGEEKVVALKEKFFGPLRERGIPYKLVAGYSDSPSDRPMLDLVKQDGGIIYAANAPREEFTTEVLADGGMAVEEIDGWLNNSERWLTFASSPSGEFLHVEKTPPRRPAWAADLGRYALRVMSDGAGFALAAPVSEAAHQALKGGDPVDWSLRLFSSAPSLAVGGFLASALTTFLVPPDGPVSWERRVIARGMIPVAAAMAAAGLTGDFTSGFWAWWVTDLPATLATAAVASAGAELVTAGERAIGLRQWRGGEERKNIIGKVFGFFGLRALQLSAFRALTFLIKGLSGV